MRQALKFLFVSMSLSLALMSSLSANEIARGEGGGGRAGGGDRGAGDRGDLNRGDLNRNDGYGGGYGGGGVYYNTGYGTTLLPDPVLTPNDDMDSIYNQNLKSMEKTGQ